MKRPPPDPAARVFTATERTEAAVLAREDALRHMPPTALERAVDDMKEGTAIGASIIAQAASASAVRARMHGTAIRQAFGRRLNAMSSATTGAVRRSLASAVNATAAFGRGLAFGVLGVWRLTARVVTGVVLVLLAIALGLAAVVVGIAGVLKSGLAMLMRAGTSAAAYSWQRRGVLSRGVARTSATATAYGRQTASALSRGVARTSATATVYGRQTASALSRNVARTSAAATAAAVRSGTQTAGVAARAGVASKDLLTRTATDLSRLRVTIRWHARSALPVVGALSDAFVTQLTQSMRQMHPRHAMAGLALAIVVMIAGLYGGPRKDRVPSGASGASPAPASQPALASVAPAPAAEAIVETLKESSAALLAPPATPPVPNPAPKTAPAPGGRRDDGEERTSSMLGSLMIASAPKGAKVTIDGVPRGVSPLSVARLRAGNRIVRLELDGYQRWSWAVYVSPSRQTRVNVSLVPDSSPSPSTAVTSTAAAAK
jgi:hypothetical protein